MLLYPNLNTELTNSDMPELNKTKKKKKKKKAEQNKQKLKQNFLTKF